MKLKCRNKMISNILLITVIMLTTIMISMFSLLYNNSGINNTHEDATIFEVKTTNELVTANELVIANELVTTNHDILKIDKAVSTHKVSSAFSNVTIPCNINIIEFLFVAFIIFCSILFISLPDDITLLNLKVRLND